MQMADKDGDGVISKEELDQAKEKVASQDPKPPAAEAALPKDTEAKDSQEDAEASHYQLVRGTLASILSGAAKRFVETKSFEEVDKDGDGVISQQEITASLTEMQVDSKEAEEAKQQYLGILFWMFCLCSCEFILQLSKQIKITLYNVYSIWGFLNTLKL